MLIGKLHTPAGVKDYLPEECSLKSEIEKNVADVFKKFGYCPVTSPTFEFNEVFCNMGGVKDSRTYKFLDRDGALLVLRPDMTPAIARIAATAYSADDIPMRFSYIENMFRSNENYQGKLREFTQAGIELLGVNSIDADTEVISVAVHSLLAAGIDSFKIDIGHALFLKGVIDESGVDEATVEAIQKNIINKNYVAVSELAEKIANEDIRYILQELPFLIGDLSVLDKVQDRVANQNSIEAINYLRQLYIILERIGLSEYISFDLGVIGSMDYYTGIIFRGYARGTGSSILDGGRYDKMVKSFGSDMPAVGFALKVNDIMHTMKPSVVKNADILVVYNESTRIEALRAAEVLRNGGLSVEIGLMGYDENSNTAYARDKKIDRVLVFNDSENVKEINVAENTQMLRNAESLLKGEAK